MPSRCCSRTRTSPPNELTNVVKGPDFPTGGIIFGRQAIRQAYSDGRGRIVVRARTHVEEVAHRPGADHRHGAALPGEQGGAGRPHRRAGQDPQDRRHQRPARRVRPPRHARRDRAVAAAGRRAAVLNSLYKHTSMQTAFAVNMLALVDREPRTIRLKSALEALHRLPSRGHPPPQRVRPRKGEGARPHPRRPAQGHRAARRGHPGDPRVGVCRRGAHTSAASAVRALASARRRPCSTCSFAVWPRWSARGWRTNTPS